MEGEAVLLYLKKIRITLFHAISENRTLAGSNNVHRYTTQLTLNILQALDIQQCPTDIYNIQKRMFNAHLTYACSYLSMNMVYRWTLLVTAQSCGACPK